MNFGLGCNRERCLFYLKELSVIGLCRVGPSSLGRQLTRVERQFRKLSVGPQDYVRFAGLRQQESYRALAPLGLDARQIVFLGYPDRGLMIDNGRKYFRPAWIRREIKRLAYLKLNRLHMHFSENLGFRIESETHPEIVSAQHLTKEEVREIVALAQRYHISVVGEIGMPGQSQW